MNLKHKKIQSFVLLFFLVLLVVPFFHITMAFDEPFTIGMIQHSYSQIIYLTSLDIHPPLYYWTLKSFLIITTFWTSNIFIKIIFARILSAIFSVITFIFLYKSLKMFKFDTNWLQQLFIFLILPFELGINQQFSNIRMYSLTMMLVSVEIYYLLKLLKEQYTKWDFIKIFFVVTASLYTNYYAGLSAGLYIIILVVSSLYKRKYKLALYSFLCGSFSMICFLPWTPYLMRQLSMASSGASVTNEMVFKFVITFVLFLTLFSFPVFYYSENINTNLKRIMIYTMIVILLSCVLNLFFQKSSLNIRYMCTEFIVYMYFGINIYIFKLRNIKKSILSVRNIFFIFSCMLIFISFVFSSFQQVKIYDEPTTSFLRAFGKYKNDTNREVSVKEHNLNAFSWDSVGGNSIYLYSINKNISDKRYLDVYKVIGNGNETLFKNIFPNVKHFYKQK